MLEPLDGPAGEFYAQVGESDGTALYRGDPVGGRWSALAGDGLRDLQLSAIGKGPGTGLYGITPEGVVTIEDRDGSVEVRLDDGSPADGQALAVIPGAAAAPPALVVGTSSGIAVSPDGGATWQVPDLPHSGGVTAFARDPERRDRLYAAVGSGFLLESGHRGANWQEINVEPVGPVGYMYVLRI
jgi:hypothetical protein